MTGESPVTIIGGGLAGCEAAWQLARRGVPVILCEQKPARRTAAQHSDDLAELVCSNSFRSRSLENAVGLIKAEMRDLGSLILSVADGCTVPAGDAMAVDRELFARGVTTRIAEEPLIALRPGEVTEIPTDQDVIIATGPLTSDSLAKRIGELTGETSLYFYDSIAPILADESIDHEVVYALSRYGKGEGDDYLNCPLDEAQYTAFHAALTAAERVPLHPFEEARYFPGCLPIEVLADRGYDTPRFGPMKPVGLPDPRTGVTPFAVVQLRKENLAGTAWNMVGFQTKLKYGDQRRVLRLIPGLEKAEFYRLGSIHRNTFLDSPRLLDERHGLRAHPRVRFAGQITGVEGYVESTASGLMVALALAAERAGVTLPALPRTTALGALMAHVQSHDRGEFQPQNVHFGLFAPLTQPMPKRERRRAYGQRARTDFGTWVESLPLSPLPSPALPSQQPTEEAAA